MPATGSGEGGTTFLLDLPQATALRDGDGLVLDDSSIVRVVGAALKLFPEAECPPRYRRSGIRD